MGMTPTCTLLSTSCGEVGCDAVVLQQGLAYYIAMSKQFTKVLLCTSSRRCPGIFSYHIACHAVRYLMSQPLDGLWAQEEPEDEGKGEGKSGGAGPAKQKCMSMSTCT